MDAREEGSGDVHDSKVRCGDGNGNGTEGNLVGKGVTWPYERPGNWDQLFRNRR
jgi:hypothetical protein